MRFFVALAAVLVISAAADEITLSFEKGENLTDASVNFAYRNATSKIFDVPLVDKVLGWVSLSADAFANPSEIKASADAMIGIGIPPTAITVPFGILAYANGTASVKVDLKSFLQSLISTTPELDAKFKGGVIAMAAISLQECDDMGKAISNIVPLNAPNADACSPKELHGDGENLDAITCTYSPSGNSGTVTITYITSKIAGILGYGYTPVSPRSLEMIIEVKNFHFSDKKSGHVRLNLGFLTASGEGSIDGNSDVVRRSGHDDLYISASQYAIVDNKRKEVKVNISSGSTGFTGIAELILNAALGGKMNAQIAHVDFPVGVDSFIYDPAVGVGSQVYQAGASTTVLSVLVVLVSIFVYLF